MTRMVLHFIMFGICLFVVGDAVGADVTEQKDRPRGTTETRSTAQQDKPPDEIQGQYIAKLKSKNRDLLNQHTAFARNYSLTVSINEKAKSMLEWDYGHIPNHLLKNLQDLSAERSRLETRIKELEKEKNDLHADALSSFDSKIPRWLSRQWAKEETDYLDRVDEIYLEVQWKLQQKKWTGEEKKYLDFMLEYYRLRRKELGVTSPQLR